MINEATMPVIGNYYEVTIASGQLGGLINISHEDGFSDKLIAALIELTREDGC